ncbi:toll/interleukin-1 receptor domain-containing protein [Ectothiorhodospiraceae bacterium WFHF3C12]|nr:toll/interleukin-1 receptor domain-containing protein [Ectothiorhodospiraceae bacterium WFHF3C12]
MVGVSSEHGRKNQAAEHSAFISYASEDRETANSVCSVLERKGQSCWIAPRDVQPGHDYGEEIIRGIEQSRAVIVIISDSANRSVFVAREVERAVSKRKPVFPVKTDGSSLSKKLELFLATARWIDYREGALTDSLAELSHYLDDERALAEGEALSKRALWRARLPRLAMAAASLFVVVVGAVVVANWYMAELLKDRGFDDTASLSSLDTKDFAIDRVDFDSHSPPAVPSVWRVSIQLPGRVLRGPLTESFFSGSIEYSLDGERFEASISPHSIRLTGKEHIQYDRIWFRHVEHDGTRHGPFGPYELDLRDVALGAVKREVRENDKSLSTGSDQVGTENGEAECEAMTEIADISSVTRDCIIEVSGYGDGEILAAGLSEAGEFRDFVWQNAALIDRVEYWIERDGGGGEKEFDQGEIDIAGREVDGFASYEEADEYWKEALTVDLPQHARRFYGRLVLIDGSATLIERVEVEAVGSVIDENSGAVIDENPFEAFEPLR